MKTVRLSDLTAPDLKHVARIVEKPIAPYEWTNVEHMLLSGEEQRQVEDIVARLRYADTTLMNEATIWSRAIYPMLVLAEQQDIQAWAQVPLRAQFAHVELLGVADGVLGSGITSLVESAYYLVVVEAKRGLENPDPRLQLYGQLLAAAHLNWERDQQPMQELFGCYTISDTWKFIRAVVQDIASEQPTMMLEFSREYDEKTEAEAILKVLKRIVERYCNPT